jgi:hypothetical protein
MRTVTLDRISSYWFTGNTSGPKDRQLIAPSVRAGGDEIGPRAPKVRHNLCRTFGSLNENVQLPTLTDGATDFRSFGCGSKMKHYPESLS